jgi:hypothetical protein
MVGHARWATVAAALLFSGVSAAEPRPNEAARVDARDASSAEEERAFEAEFERQERLVELTRRFAERAFEEALDRFARYSELTKRLAEEARLREQQEFESAVDLYMRKRELTQTLAARPIPAPETTTPGTRESEQPY